MANTKIEFTPSETAELIDALKLFDDTLAGRALAARSNGHHDESERIERRRIHNQDTVRSIELARQAAWKL